MASADRDVSRRMLLAAGGVTLAAVTVPIGIYVDQARRPRAWKVLQAGNEEVNAVAFLPSGGRLACGSDTGVTLWDLDTGRCYATLAEGRFNSVAGSPDGRRVAACGADLGVWSTVPTASAPSWPPLDGASRVRPASVAFDPSGHRLAVGGWDGTVRLWDLDTGKVATTLTGLQAPVEQVLFSPESGLLATSESGGPVRLRDARTAALLSTLSEPQRGGAPLAFSPDGRVLAGALAGPDGTDTIRLWDVPTGSPHNLAQGLATVTALAFSPTGRTLATGADQLIQLWDLRSRRVLTHWSVPDVVNCLSFDSSGHLLAAAVNDGTAQLFRASA